MKLRTQLLAVGLVILAVGIMAFLNIGPSPITGFISAPTYSQQVNTVIEKDSGYVLVPSNLDSDSELQSLRVSGKIYGTGVVKIYIEDADSTRYLVYSNQKVKSFNRITGFAVNVNPGTAQSSETENQPFLFKETDSFSSYKEYSPEEKENLKIETDGTTGLVSGSPKKEDISFEFDPLSGLPDDENRPPSSEFNAECQETCAFFSRGDSFKFIFEIEPGTHLQLTEIIYTINEENKPLYNKTN